MLFVSSIASYRPHTLHLLCLCDCQTTNDLCLPFRVLTWLFVLGMRDKPWMVIHNTILWKPWCQRTSHPHCACAIALLVAPPTCRRAVPVCAFKKKRGDQNRGATKYNMDSGLEGGKTLPIFDEYGFVIPREDQDGLESRSHEYRCLFNDFCKARLLIK